MTVLVCFCTCPNPEIAQRIADALVEDRLAACVNVVPGVRSIYRWKGAIETADEVAAILKTHHWRSDALIERIAQLHSYETPCVVSWPIDKIVGSYADWIEDVVIRER